ncbi:hypothetical protein MAPG_10946 [Magnaporthiopsis poae ATCC 64411]|uniref:Uncharacterized protein n=1 Tax=Magnaporthiopsis poae (strain ATCC 64411 / 73-15) TaxID=644358 RepID=A0A0C4EDY6_MAGP6|nr:hypothetical protein MAPG_10946 [Magnaporthiopsis poae ATCC 64411]
MRPRKFALPLLRARLRLTDAEASVKNYWQRGKALLFVFVAPSPQPCAMFAMLHSEHSTSGCLAMFAMLHSRHSAFA